MTYNLSSLRLSYLLFLRNNFSQLETALIFVLHFFKQNFKASPKQRRQYTECLCIYHPALTWISSADFLSSLCLHFSPPWIFKNQITGIKSRHLQPFRGNSTWSSFHFCYYTWTSVVFMRTAALSLPQHRIPVFLLGAAFHSLVVLPNPWPHWAHGHMTRLVSLSPPLGCIMEAREWSSLTTWQHGP